MSPYSRQFIILGSLVNRHSVASGTPWKVRRAHIQTKPFHRPSTSTFTSSTKGRPFPRYPSRLISRPSGVHHNPPPSKYPEQMQACISTSAQRSSSHPPRCFAAYPRDISRKRVRFGAGRGTSGALHHLYVQELKVVKEGTRCNAFDVENAIPKGDRKLVNHTSLVVISTTC